MIRPALGSLASIALSAAALAAQIPASAFKAASASDSAFFLESPVPLDWQVIALSARPEFQPAHPDTNLIRKFYDEEYGGSSSIPYEAPLPPLLPTGAYWVLGDSGATEVHPRKVSGTIYVETDTVGWPANRVIYFGSLKAARRPGTHIGAPRFGFFSPRPIRVRSVPAAIGGTDLQPTVRTTLGPRRIAVPIDSTGRNRSRDLKPVHALAFQILETGQSFLSVLWPDDDICLGESILYDISTGVGRFVALSFGACGE